MKLEGLVVIFFSLFVLFCFRYVICEHVYFLNMYTKRVEALLNFEEIHKRHCARGNQFGS